LPLAAMAGLPVPVLAGLAAGHCQWQRDELSES
jgi:hypothetical protein